MKSTYTGTLDDIVPREQTLTECMNVATAESVIERGSPMRDRKRRRESDKENWPLHEVRLSKVVRIAEEEVGLQRCLRVTCGGEFVTIESLRTEMRIGCSGPPSMPQGVQRCATVVANGVLGDWRLNDATFRHELNFRLEDKAPYVDCLAALHPFPRDARIVFKETPHIYSVDGIRAPWSVSDLVHSLAHGFDPTSAVRTMTASRTWHERHPELTSPDGGPMTESDIIDAWRVNGETQSKRGTLMHWHIEIYLNGYDVAEPHSPEFLQFLLFKRCFMDPLGLVPLRTELSMFHCGLCIAGQADLLCLDANGDAVIVDWKRSANIKTEGFRGQMLHPPLEHMDDCNWSTYRLQINMYAYILESEYGLQVAAMYIAVFHPNQCGVPYVYVVPRMAEEIQTLVNHAARVHGTRLESVPGDKASFDVSGFRSTPNN